MRLANSYFVIGGFECNDRYLKNQIFDFLIQKHQPKLVILMKIVIIIHARSYQNWDALFNNVDILMV